jgi:hypothetical protein
MADGIQSHDADGRGLMASTCLKVLGLEAAIIAVLWVFGQLFS